MKKFSILLTLLAFSISSNAQVTATKLPPGKTLTDVKKLVTKSSNVVGASRDNEGRDDFGTMKEAKSKFEKTKRYQLDVTAFTDYFHKHIKDSVTGYVLQMTRGGKVISNIKWNWAQTPSDASQGWDFDTKMHVASVSKYITAMGMYKALKLANINVDTKIYNYLPKYWTKGQNINKITFRHLLTHTAGFHYPCCSADFAFIKDKIAAGVPGVGGKGDYHNMNFGLCRILIATVMGYMNPNTIMTDEEWDGYSILWFRYFTADRIFNPAGVSGEVVINPAQKHALGYNFPAGNSDGLNSGDLSTSLGAVGWRLSVSDLLKIMDLARRHNDIFRGGEFQEALDAYLGIDQIINTPAGKIYNKNGGWGINGKTEQSVIYFLPDDMEVAVLVNSTINNGAGTSLRGRVYEAYLNSLKLK